MAAIAVIAGLWTSNGLHAAEYRVIPAETDVFAGEIVNLTVEVETEPGDNLIDVGHFSFAIDLALTGDAGATADDISNIAINEMDFDDLLSNSYGYAAGNQYLDAAGVTTDAFAPNFGSGAGDVIWLFDFDLAIPTDAPLLSTITITPGEGFLESLTVNDFFDPVSPQNFTSATLTVVPEPATALLLLMAGLQVLSRRPRN